MTATVGRDWNLVSALVALGIVVAAGCGPAVRTVPVTGRLTFNGGPPPPDSFVSFIPSASAAGQGDAAPPARPGGAVCDTDGNFDASSLRGQRGLLPGRYDVRIIAFAGGGDPSSDEPPRSKMPAGFTPPELVVDGSARSVRYDVDVPATAKK